MFLDFTNNIVLFNRNIVFRELKVKHLKIIYKCLLGDEPDPKIIIKNFNNIIQHITDLSEEEILNLNFLEFMCLLFEVRSISIGNIIYAEIPDMPNFKIEININKFSEIINQIDLNDFLKKETKDNFEIHYRLPTITELAELTTNTTIENIYNLFIEKINYLDTVIDLSKLDKSETNKILQHLPAKLTTYFIQKTFLLLKTFNNINLISYIHGLENKQLPLNLNINNLIGILKLIFGDHLLTLYENIFAICKLANFTPEYIENCSPGEYLLFVKKLEKLTSKNQISDIPVSSENFSESLEYPDLPPIVGENAL